MNEKPTPERMPSLRELGLDLLRVPAWQRLFTICVPFLFATGYFVFASHDCWPLAVFSLMALSFSTYGSTSHDLVHRNLGLPRWCNESLLCVTELLAVRSGHAYRKAHLHHHARFPHADDIEGAAARRSLLGAWFAGLTLQYRIWFWAVRRDDESRTWIIMEGVLVLAVATSALLVASMTWVPIFYVALMLFGHSFLPVFTVYLVHDATATNELFQTRAFRGRLASMLAFEHLYHLEHHLFPKVPHTNWPELARRLEPFLRRAGVRFRGIGGCFNHFFSAPSFPSISHSRLNRAKQSDPVR